MCFVPPAACGSVPQGSGGRGCDSPGAGLSRSMGRGGNNSFLFAFFQIRSAVLSAGRGGFMRRFLTLVCLLGLALPAGISISGCVRNPAGNYCNGLGYGLKDTDVANLTLQPQIRGYFACLRADHPDPVAQRHHLQRRTGCHPFRRAQLRHHQQSVGRHLSRRLHLRRHLEPQHAAAASPITLTAITPTRCLRREACLTPSRTSRPRPTRSHPTPSRSTSTPPSRASAW